MSIQASEKSWEKALKSFDRTKESFDEDVETVKKWVQTQPHFPEIMDEKKIRNFLIINKCSVEITKKKIDNYYTMPSAIPDLYDDRNPKKSNMIQYLEDTYCFTFPKMVDDLYRIYFCKIHHSVDHFPAAEISMNFFNIFEMRLMEDCMVGEIYIFDWEMITLGNVLGVTPTIMAKIFTVLEKVYSLRIKAVYYVNTPPYMSYMTAMLKKILKPKIFSRFQVYEDTAILKTILSEDILPKDYGGNGPTLKEHHDAFKLKLKEYEARFDELDKLRVDESLRPEKLKNDELLGFHGNFKKLSVD